MNQIVRKAAGPAALVLGLGVAATAMEAVHDPIRELGAQAPVAAPGGPGELATAFRAASKAALPAVVRVEVEAAPRTVSRTAPEQFRGTPFEDFFGSPRGQQSPQRPQRGSGSGFIISQDGYILTNNHVVERASRVTVELTDKREFVARVVGRDPNTDVAVLKVEAEGLPTVRLGDPDALQVGDWVLALGYPMSLGETVTAGIVSAKGRSIGIMRQNEDAQAPLEHFIQTDAAINPGNSGGPLVDLHGTVIGINTAIASPTGAYSGYGFAVPIHLAKRIADDLIRDGVVHRPRLGVQIKPVSLADVEVFGLSAARGAVVASVQKGPARDAGIRLGDVVVAVAGDPVDGPDELMEKVALRRPGETVALDVVRYGDRKRVNVRLGAFAVEAAEPAAREPAARDEVSRLGFAVTEVTAQIARDLGLKEEGGVVVSQVDPMGPAAEADLRRGMRVDRLNGVEIRSAADLRAAAARLRAGSTVSIVGRLPDGSETIVNYRLHG